MKLAVMQPYFFPYIGYFQLINAVDKFVIYDDVSFIKRGWINRNRILLNGSSHTFTIPVLKASQNNTITNTHINPSLKWREKLLMTFQHAYTNAPYFEQVYPLLEAVVFSPCHSITDYAVNSLEAVLHFLEIRTEIVSSSSMYENKQLKGPERILDICLKEGATTYINPSGGQDLYERQAFNDVGIDLKFICPSRIIYTQQKNTFVENLSIIDVLMFNSKERTKLFLKQFELE